MNIQDWLPPSPLQGPPLPRLFNIYWPWIVEELPPEEAPPEEQPPEEQPPEEPPAQPGYSVALGFSREPVCMTSRGDECLEWSQDERKGTLEITNTGAQGTFKVTLEAWTYLDNEPHNNFKNLSWTDNLTTGQLKTHSFNYMVPISGMALDTRFFVKVYDPDNNLIADQGFQTPL